MSDPPREALESWERQDKPFHEHADELAAALRGEMKRWASARGDAATFAAEREVLAAIVRDLAESTPTSIDDVTTWCAVCDRVHPHHYEECAFARSVAWVAAQEAK